MKTIYLIETNPIVNEYFTNVHCGYINTCNNIDDSTKFNSYESAQSYLNYLVLGDFESDKVLYLSIVSFIVK